VRERIKRIEKREMSRKVYKIGFGSLNKVVLRKDESEEEEEHCGCVVVDDGVGVGVGVGVTGFCILRMFSFFVFLDD
jgi:hypothetical protein